MSKRKIHEGVEVQLIAEKLYSAISESLASCTTREINERYTLAMDKNRKNKKNSAFTYKPITKISLEAKTKIAEERLSRLSAGIRDCTDSQSACPVCGKTFMSYSVLCAHINISHKAMRKEAIAKAQEAFDCKERAEEEERHPLTNSSHITDTLPSFARKDRPVRPHGIVKELVKRNRRANHCINTRFICYLCGYTHQEGGEFVLEGQTYRVCRICQNSITQLNPYGKEILVNFEGSRKKH